MTNSLKDLTSKFLAGRHLLMSFIYGERPVHPNDLNATLLRALGIDQHLVFVHHNRKEIPTVLGGTVIPELFA